MRKCRFSRLGIKGIAFVCISSYIEMPVRAAGYAVDYRTGEFRRAG